MIPNTTTAENFLALGRTGKSSWWRYLVGTFLIVCSLAIVQIGFVIILKLMNPGKHITVDPKTGDFLGVDPMVMFVGAFFTFVIWLISISQLCF